MPSSRNSLRQLFLDRRFAPLFWTQALGAFNDNVVKNAIVLLITYQSAVLLGLSAEKLVALCGGIFILPFFLFSALAGEVADQRSKSKLSTYTKLWEIGVVLCSGAGFLLNSLPLLLTSLFLLGTQATFFGPIKYGILPELLDEKELLSGNALVELGTFISILLGTILGGILMGLGPKAPIWVASIALLVAVAGWFTSRLILPQAARAPGLKPSFHPIRPTMDLLRIAKKVKSVHLALYAISWFWLLGSIVLSILPHLVKAVIGGNEHVLTFFLALFSLGVGLGTVLCERLSFRTLELGLVPLGSIGMTLFALDLGLLHYPHAAHVSELFSTFAGWRLSADLFLFSASAGVFTVPLYTLIQIRSDEKERSRVIAANNVLNALFMVVGAIGLMAMYAAGLTVSQIFLILAVLNGIVAIFVYFTLPEFLFRFMLWLCSHLLYRVKVEGAENFPETGAGIVVCNHVSFIDWMLVCAACSRPTRFVIHQDFMRIPVFGFMAKHGKVIPIAGMTENLKVMKQAFVRVAEELDDGQLVCIFPEGEITKTGEMTYFRKGVEKILERNPVPVIPIALDGMWGSFFSRRYGKAMTKPIRRFSKPFYPVTIRVGKPVPASEATAERLQDEVAALLGVKSPPIPKGRPS